MKMIITAISNNGVVSKDGKIPFVTPATAHYFSELTKNSTIILGYNTWISMNETPMPGRKHIILTRNPFKVVNKRNVSSATCVEDVVTEGLVTLEKAEVHIYRSKNQVEEI